MTAISWSCVQVVVAEVPDIILRCVSRDEAALAVAQKVHFLQLDVCIFLLLSTSL